MVHISNLIKGFLVLTIFFLIYPQSTVAEILSGINLTTNRAYRTEIMCRVARGNHKARLRGWDNLRVSPVNFAYADLYGDGTIDFVSGFSDEAYKVDPRFGLSKYYKGNEVRSRRPFQYSFYSPVKNFKVPVGTKFNMARTILAGDYNSDGVDDLAFIQYGVDYPPYTPWRNEIMLSSEDGYQVSYLPGLKSTFHGGDSGDVDNDGDVDIIASPGLDYSVLLYLNDGTGKFNNKTVISKNSSNKSHNVFLWDVDNDGNLDILATNKRHGIDIFWGNGNGTFDQNSSPVVLSTDRSITVHDFEVYQSEKGKGQHIFFISSVGQDINDNTPYKGWTLTRVSISGRHIDNFKLIDSVYLKNGFHWMARFSACDLNGDTIPDLVYEHHGEQSPFMSVEQSGTVDNDLSRTDKVIWMSANEGYHRYRVEHPIYFDPKYADNLNKVALSLGVSIKRYVSEAVFFPHPEGVDFILYASRNMQPYPSRPLNNGTKLEQLVSNICSTPEGSIHKPEICEEYSYVSQLLREHQRTGQELADIIIPQYCWDFKISIKLIELKNGTCRNK